MKDQDRPILVVEDSDSDYEATRWALGECASGVSHVRCENGEEVIDYLENRGRFADGERTSKPLLVLLDLNLPRMDGRQVLEYIRKSPHAHSLPVIVMTSSSNPAEIDACYRAGANSYFLKPMDLFEYGNLVDVIVKYWVERAMLPAVWR